MVVPALNEADQIGGAIESARAAGDCEIIVADGGSSDDTTSLASSADVVIQTTRGRAVQQNAGAAAATGDVLLFLHADCRLAAGAFDAVRNCLADDRVAGGCFQQRIDGDGRLYRWVERGNALRVRWLKWAYGDQGIFVRRKVFEELGGFPEVALMEDLYFMKRLKSAGRFVLLNERLRVSARRWERTGVARQTVRNWTLITLAHLGVAPDRLARYY